MDSIKTHIYGRKIILFLCGLILVSGLLTSCGKEFKVTQYQIIFGTSDISQPRDIPDEEVRTVYLQLIDDVNRLKTVVDDYWQIEVVNDRFGPEDENAIARYNSRLTQVKDLEAACKRKIEALGAHPESSFYAKVIYQVKRSVPADYSSDCLQEYTFELKYNR
jgi:hypothetical protein